MNSKKGVNKDVELLRYGKLYGKIAKKHSYKNFKELRNALDRKAEE